MYKNKKEKFDMKKDEVLNKLIAMGSVAKFENQTRPL